MSTQKCPSCDNKIPNFNSQQANFNVSLSPQAGLLSYKLGFRTKTIPCCFECETIFKTYDVNNKEGLKKLCNDIQTFKKYNKMLQDSDNKKEQIEKYSKMPQDSDNKKEPITKYNEEKTIINNENQNEYLLNIREQYIKQIKQQRKLYRSIIENQKIKIIKYENEIRKQKTENEHLIKYIKIDEEPIFWTCIIDFFDYIQL
jgi:hypothetical protein